MASPNISFASIPTSIRKPGKYIEFNLKLAVSTLPSNAQHQLFIAQRLATGLAPVNTPFRVFSAEDAATYWGRGSQLHLMVRAALKANRYAFITGVGVDDAGAGAAAAGPVTFTGTASGAGVASMAIGYDKVEVAVASGATAAAVAAAIKEQLDKSQDWPVTFAINAGAITATNKHKGTVGNTIPYSASVTAPGLAVAVTQPTAGAVDPDLTATLASLFSASDEILVVPYGTQAVLTLLRTHINDRSGALEQRGGVVVYASTGTLSAGTTLSGQMNAGRLVSVLLAGSASPAYEIAAAFASVVAFEEDPAMPLNTLSLTGIAPPALANQLSRTEQEVCLANGLSPLEVGPGEVVQIVRAVTTYTKNGEGVNDISLLDLTTIRTLDYVRKACRERISLRFPRDKKSKRKKDKVWSELYDVLLKLEELEIIENVEANKAGLIVEDDSQDPNRLNVAIPVDVVNGLHVFAGVINLIL